MRTISRIFDIPKFQAENNPLENSLSSKVDGQWLSISSKEYVNNINQFSRGLHKFGVKKGDKIAIISTNNSPEWFIADMGILQVGAHSVPIYPNISEADYIYIFNHAEISLCFVSDEELEKKINAIRKDILTLKEVYSFDIVENCKNWQDILDLGKNHSCQTTIETIKASIKETDMATIIYTSGTTGKPKGVMLSHKNIISNVLGCLPRLPIKPHQKTLSFLPLCHIYERTVSYIYQHQSISIYFAESLDTIGNNIREIKPQIINVVPRLLEKIFDTIKGKGLELKGLKKLVFFLALDFGLHYDKRKEKHWFYKIKTKLAQQLVLNKIMASLGGKLQAVISGSAPLQEKLGRLYNAVGVMVLEGYGLTETSPVIAVTDYRDSIKYGTVGTALPHTQVKILPDGEIACKGPGIMMGYYKDNSRTQEVTYKEGYFLTGDLGAFDEEGYLKITGRKKEMFKTSGGKYIAPQYIEDIFKASNFIEHIIVIGDGEKMPSVLIQPNFQFLDQWCKRKRIDTEMTYKEKIRYPLVYKRYAYEINKLNKKLAKWEQIKAFELTSKTWSVEGGELTPTMKIKRKSIITKYQNLYKKIYG